MFPRRKTLSDISLLNKALVLWGNFKTLTSISTKKFARQNFFPSLNVTCAPKKTNYWWKTLSGMFILCQWKNIYAKFLSKSLLKIHWCRFQNLPRSSSWLENNMPKDSHYKSFYVLWYAYVKYVKRLFTNIQKQRNKMEISLFFKRCTNFTDKKLKNSYD